MLFDYPKIKHVRRHGPSGYAEYTGFKPWLRDDFVFRCVFCLVRERMKDPGGQDSFGVEHLKPKKKNPTLICVYENLVYACLQCNSFKGELGGVPDPCLVIYANQVEVRSDGTIHGLTQAGEKMIRVLRLDRDDLTEFRRRYLRMEEAAAKNPRSDLAREFKASIFSFPQDLPDLCAARPPGGNSKPEGANTCYRELRNSGTLPETY
jgi:hypothetical protein